MLLYLILFDLFIECDQRKLQSKDSFITLKTNKTGNIQILSDLYHSNNPDEIYINNINKNETQRIFFLIVQKIF